MENHAANVFTPFFKSVGLRTPRAQIIHGNRELHMWKRPKPRGKLRATKHSMHNYVGSDHGVHGLRRVGGGLIPDDVVTARVVGPRVVRGIVELVGRRGVELLHLRQMMVERGLDGRLCCLVDMVPSLLRTGKREWGV